MAIPARQFYLTASRPDGRNEIGEWARFRDPLLTGALGASIRSARVSRKQKKQELVSEQGQTEICGYLSTPEAVPAVSSRVHNDLVQMHMLVGCCQKFITRNILTRTQHASTQLPQNIKKVEQSA